MDKSEFQARVDGLGLPREELAERLGLSVPGLNHQLYGLRRVSRQTEIILGYLERDRMRKRRRSRAAG
jgi:hypothetical protein